MQDYQAVLVKIKELGDYIHQFSGKAPDIGVAKQWLTQYDLEVEQQLCNFISLFDPEASFFAEEENEYLNKDAESLWIIDPISNTFNFIHGLPHYSITVAHSWKGKIVFSAVYDPSVNELFFAERGKGAYLNNSKIQASKNTSDLSILIGPHLTPKDQEKNQKLISIISQFSKEGTIRIIGSLGVHYAWVAMGRVDLAISLSKDIFPEMAGSLLVTEAGGSFTDFKGESINFETREIVATNRVIHENVLGII